MARKNVRVDIPVGNVDRTLKLGEDIQQRHVELDADSPLTDIIDMAEFGTLLTAIAAKRTPAITDGRKKEAWNEKALRMIGIAKGQNLEIPGTVFHHINKVHRFMAFKFRGNEEQASLWGFDVVVGQTNGRRHVNFNIPYGSPQGMIDLASDILSKHGTDGVDTIFPASLFDMDGLQQNLDTAVQLREDAEESNQQKQANNQAARVLCGYGEGQTSQTHGTLYYEITRVRDLLLIAYDGNEEQLSLWGFNVVVSATGGGKKAGETGEQDGETEE